MKKRKANDVTECDDCIVMFSEYNEEKIFCRPDTFPIRRG
jgi:hypothetical protein